MSSINPCEPGPVTASRTASLAAVFCATMGVGLIFGFQPPLLALVLSRQGESSFAIGALWSVFSPSAAFGVAGALFFAAMVLLLRLKSR